MSVRASAIANRRPKNGASARSIRQSKADGPSPWTPAATSARSRASGIATAILGGRLEVAPDIPGDIPKTQERSFGGGGHSSLERRHGRGEVMPHGLGLAREEPVVQAEPGEFLHDAQCLPAAIRVDVQDS